jgi:TPR repeat protein
MLRHEERLQRAFLCFRTGYRLDPYNREIHYVLAEYYSVGLGVARDEDAALNHLRKSATLGHRGAQRALGYRYSASLRNGPEQEPAWFMPSEQAQQLLRGIRTTL